MHDGNTHEHNILSTTESTDIIGPGHYLICAIINKLFEITKLKINFEITEQCIDMIHVTRLKSN